MSAQTIKVTERHVKAFAPGRTEIAGNHVDHQGGRVLSGALTWGISAEAVPCDELAVTVESEGFAPFTVGLGSLDRVAEETGTSAALVRGVAAQLAAAGAQPGGFVLKASSTIPTGGGLSSSAAFELLMGQVMNLLWADGRVGAVELAKMAKTAECDYFGKPCGLQDQLAIACGGINLMDFADPDKPGVRRVQNRFDDMGLDVCLVDVGADHSASPEAFASIPRDMRDVAAYFGGQVLNDVSEQEFSRRLPEVRAALGDRKAMRAMHYFQEVRLVDARVRALESGDAHSFLVLTRRSAQSSAEWLQNVFIPDSESQPAALALALADSIMLGSRGVARIHGGGFGGSIQVFVDKQVKQSVQDAMDAVFGVDAMRTLEFGTRGAWAEWM